SASTPAPIAHAAISPAPIPPAGGRAVWQGPDVDYRKEGTKVLIPAEVAEIDAALAHLEALGERDFPAITPEAFPLPTLGPCSAAWSSTPCTAPAASSRPCRSSRRPTASSAATSRAAIRAAPSPPATRR